MQLLLCWRTREGGEITQSANSLPALPPSTFLLRFKQLMVLSPLFHFLFIGLLFWILFSFSLPFSHLLSFGVGVGERLRRIGGTTVCVCVCGGGEAKRRGRRPKENRNGILLLQVKSVGVLCLHPLSSCPLPPFTQSGQNGRGGRRSQMRF